MKTVEMNVDQNKNSESVGSNFFECLWEKSRIHVNTAVDVVHDAVLILDRDFRIIAANQPFYRTFQVEVKDTEKRILYALGNGQWNIPGLKKLLEDILPKKTFFKGFEVAHVFPLIGRKVMILNARQIYFKKDPRLTPQIILLAMEDITEMIDVAEMIAHRKNQ